MMNHQSTTGPCKRRAIAAALASCLVLGNSATYATPLKRQATHNTIVSAATLSSPCVRVEMGPLINVAVGKSTLIRPEVPIARILLGNPDHVTASKPIEVTNETALEEKKKGVAAVSQDTGRLGVADVDVVLLSPKEIYLLGKTVGSTNVVLLDKAGQCTVVDVIVSMDTVALQAALKQLLPTETGIVVTAAADTLVLSGFTADTAKADRALELANAFVRRGTQGAQTGRSDRVVNMLSIAAPQQVMLEVKVAEISKSVLDRFGINFSRAYAPGDGSMLRFLSGVFGGVGAVMGQVSGTNGAQVGGGAIGSTTNGSATGAITGPMGSASIGGGTTSVPLIAGSGSTSIGIDAQKSDGLVKILAEPTIMAISGQEGSFLAGGKIFIPVAQSNSGGQSITLEEKEFGVSVRFTPTVLEGGRINLVVRPEVSELSRQGVGISAPGVNGLAILPSFTTRKASTTVQLFDGQSFAIGGLIKNNVTTNIKAFPILGELPVLGALFRSSDFQTDRSELVFVITARLIKPLPQDYQLPTDAYVQPSRSEFFVSGKMEGAASPESKSTSKAATGFEIK